MPWKAENRVCFDSGLGIGNRSPGVYDPGAVAGGIEEATGALQYVLTFKYFGIYEFAVDPKQIVLTRDDSTDYTPVGRQDDMAVPLAAPTF